VNAAQPVVVVPTPDRPTKCDASLKATPQTKRKKREHVQHVEHDAPGTPAKKMKTKQHRTQVPDAAAKPQARGESPVFLCVVWAPPRRELWVTAGFPPSLQPCQPSIILGQPFVERTITEGT
jgi:hypothetical protein